MATTFKSTESGAGGFISNVTPTTILTAPSGGTDLGVLCQKLVISNVTTTARDVTIYKVPSGGSISGDDFKMVVELEVPAKGGVLGGHVDVRAVAGVLLEPGDSLRALASAASALKFGDFSYQELTS